MKISVLLGDLRETKERIALLSYVLAGRVLLVHSVMEAGRDWLFLFKSRPLQPFLESELI